MKKFPTFSLAFQLLNVVLVLSQSIKDDFNLNWTIQNDVVNFVYTSPVAASNNVWLAFGFSTDTSMGDDCVCLCKMMNNQGSVEHYYNSGQTQPSLLDAARPSVGISNTTVKVDNGVMTCTFTRAKQFAGLPNYFDIKNNQYRILHARGTITSGQINYHFDTKKSDSERYSFNTPEEQTTQSAQTSVSVGTTATSSSLQSQSVIRDYNLKWTIQNDSVDFVYTSPVEASDNVWLAFGFSTDTSMGNDCVCLCKLVNNVPTVEHFYNSGKFQPSLLDAARPSVGISNVAVKVQNGVMTCSFSRTKSFAGVTNYFDISKNKYYILNARGIANADGTIRAHSDKVANTVLFSFADIASTTVGPTSNTETTASKTSASTAVTTATPSVQSESIIGGFDLKWSPKTDVVDFVYKTPVAAANNIWVAFAFSTDTSMGNDCVCMCKVVNNVGTVEHYYNSGKSRPSLLDAAKPSVGIIGSSVKVENGVMTCSFTRAKSTNTIARQLSVPNYFDINNQYYILHARGPIVNGVLEFHTNFVANSRLFSFNGQPVNTQAQGSFESEGFKLKWTYTSTSTTFNLEVRNCGKNIWAAFGLSNDQKMGDDNVIACKSPGKIEHYYNMGKSPSLLNSANPTVGLSDASVTYENGLLKCSVTRMNSMVNQQNYFDLNNQYYLLVATGPLSGDSLQIHTKKLASEKSIDFKVDSTNGGAKENEDVAKAHACIMVIAWMFCASTGILFARYFKFLFPKWKPFELQVWFVVHRPLMMFVAFASVIGFIIILADSDWKWLDTKIVANFVHSIFGIVTIGLSVIQVIYSFWRPDKTHPKRFIFNYIHRTIGISTFIFSIITIFLGVTMSKMRLGRIGWGIMIGWVIWVVVLPAFIEIFKIIFEGRKAETYEMSATPGNTPKPVNRAARNLKFFEGIKSFFLVLHIIFALGLTVALVVIIAMADDERFIVCDA